MNIDLENLYLSKWESLLKESSQIKAKAACPLLVKVNHAYVEADVKVMIVGQETDGWHRQLNMGDVTVEELMDVYSEYYSQRKQRGKDHGKRAFWNWKNYRYFEEKLTSYYRDCSNKSASFIWNNISKIGNDGRGMPSREIRALERNHFNVFLDEFKILKPDVVIFTTGSTRDSFIEHHFGKGVQLYPKLSLGNGMLAKETLNLIAEVRLPQFPTIKAIRIEHPNRRTLSNSVTLQVLKSMAEMKT